MITLRCTRKAAQRFGFSPAATFPPGTSRSGDWYVNLIATRGGRIFLFTNERSLLSVTVPAKSQHVMQDFVRRAANALSMIGASDDVIHEELEHFSDFQIAKAINGPVLATMTWIAYYVQHAFDRATPENPVSLSDLELMLARTPYNPIGMRTPSVVAMELLAVQPTGIM